MGATPKVESESHQEGSRWIGDPPSGPDVASWFASSVKLHDGMEPDKYVSGVTLITSTEKVKRLVNGAITEIERLVHVPYAKVETRIAYFWDLCAEKGWHGVIEPVKVPRVNYANMLNEHLPPGFFRVPVQIDTGQFVHYVACSMKVTVFEKDMRAGGRGRVILDAPPATKQIALVNRFKEADPYALMKAETGAVGRALGMAGMLALPGSGVATAEDMMEAQTDQRSLVQAPEVVGPEATGDAAAAPAPTPGDRIATLSSQLESEAPGKFEEMREWAKGRDIDLNDIKSTQQRAVLKQLEKLLAG